MNIPVITSVGRPPELHAARVVGQMLHWLFAHRLRLDDEMVAAFRNTRSRLGSPKAQLRHLERLRKLSTGAVIDLGMETGKRGKYRLQWTTWDVVAPRTCEQLNPDEPLPDRPWLTCLVTHIDGPGYRDTMTRDERIRHYRTFTFTHHALQRLAERCDARTPIHLLAALVELWRVMRDAMNADTLRRKATTIRLPLPRTGGSAVIEWVPEIGYLVKTVLEPT